MWCLIWRCRATKLGSEVFASRGALFCSSESSFLFYFLLSVRGMTILLWNCLLIIVFGLKCWQSSIIVISAFKYNQVLPQWVISSHIWISRVVCSSMNAYSLCVCHNSSNSCEHNFTSTIFSLCPATHAFIFLKKRKMNRNNLKS